NSWFVLSILAASIIWRSTGSVAYQICNGMGRADINLMASIATAVLMTVPICILAPARGARGVAMGAFIGLLTQNMLFDLYTQRKLLGVKAWGESLSAYARIIAASAAAVLAYELIPLPLGGWAGLFVKACLIECLYFGSSLMTGALSAKDVRFVTNKIKRMFSAWLGWSTSG
ncbi:MAG: polysaccharide biosynthesis C-terminal domain-containing protein, partial [Acidobacteriota bacterium]|nr:polysaccharide biosynthesis C-terminal domain-containing protein [Acidobacteriota bacterium]